MKLNRKSLQLYVVTDQSFLNGKNFLEEIELILEGGATFLQLREKNESFEAYLALAKEVKKITDAYGIPFVINDAVDVAIEMNADGVHVGQSDLEASKVREKIGPHKILGVSAQTVEQAVLAQQQGADYIGVGALFTTNTKRDA
ncbi:MAG: thiamine phosphate synthase, partial [Turicibacter sp.]